MMNLIRLLSSLVLVTLLSACVHRTLGTDSLSELEQLSSKTVYAQSDGINSFRLQALQDVALSLGAQAGLASRAKHLNAQLDERTTHLDHVFDFNALVLEHNVLPPVLSEGRETYNVSSDDTIRAADRVYKIINQARFVTTAPNWREYLFLNFKKPEMPNKTLLPANNKERVVWEQYIKRGWKEGATQADTIFDANLARLKRDYNGMLLYRKLLAQGIVTPPFVAKTDLGITGDGSDMRIHDQVLRIAALPKLQTNSQKWGAAVRP